MIHNMMSVRQLTDFTNPRMHPFHIPQCSIQNRNVHMNRNVHISVMNGALWDMEQVHSGICELGQLSMMEPWRHHRGEYISGIILGVGLANERRCYIVMLSLIGWAQTRNNPCISEIRIHHNRDHSGYGLSQWEMTLQCNVTCHWLS